jgi:hypothetical protein
MRRLEEFWLKAAPPQSIRENPRRDRKILRIDFVVRKDKTPRVPFCRGITLEEK